jgi:hypothetical protein
MHTKYRQGNLMENSDLEDLGDMRFVYIYLKYNSVFSHGIQEVQNTVLIWSSCEGSYVNRTEE